VVAAVVVVAPTVSDTGGDHEVDPAAGALLPDLDQETPSQLDIRVSDDGDGYVLGFASAIRNIGDAPMILEGSRTTAGATTPMQVSQVLEAADGSRDLLPDVGELTYVVSPDHQHWHYVGFDHYELRRPGSDQAVVRDRKSGFCLGDRYRVDSRVVTGAASAAVYTDECGLNDSELTHVVEGISVGYGDTYAANLEYQELPLDGLPDGRYVLVHRVNEDQSLKELTYANNAASLLLDLRWRDGRPLVRVLASCPDTDRCDQQVSVTTVATGLQVPWDLAFLPDGAALVTERPGRVRLLTADGRLQPTPVARVEVSQRGEGGLLGLVLDPEFVDNQFVYLYYTGGGSMRLERWRWTGTRLVPDATLVDDIRAGDVHDSGRVAFAPDGRLFLATGDAGQPSLAQDPESLNGKMLALTPAQYRGRDVVRPEVVASGLRNSQGFDWQPQSSMLVANDHGPTGFDGPQGYDEVNVIVTGGNYGWPNAMSDDTGGGRYLAPRRIYLEAIAPSGGVFLTGSSAWQGDYVLAALRGEELRRLVFENGRVVVDEPMLEGLYGRLRTVTEAPDGSLYVLTSNRDGRGLPRPGDDRILRVELPGP
jgi:glucose/arabinose dehydrogenase